MSQLHQSILIVSAPAPPAHAATSLCSTPAVFTIISPPPPRQPHKPLKPPTPSTRPSTTTTRIPCSLHGVSARILCHWACYDFGSAYIWVRAPFLVQASHLYRPYKHRVSLHISLGKPMLSLFPFAPFVCMLLHCDCLSAALQKSLSCTNSNCGLG